MAEPIITVKDLNFYYDYKTPLQMLALKNVNLEIDRGQYVVFFGPSGCGKTTLVYLVSGITTGDNGTGKITVNGQDILGLSRDELSVFRQTGIGIIFQQFNLVPSLSVLDNVALPMTFIGVPQDKRRKDAYEILKRLNMEKYADRYPSELSGGQQQRVGIARALANNPPIIIADEPLGNLDSENAEQVLKFLKELQENDGRTIIMVTHEAWSVRDADKIIYLKDGGVTKTSEPVKRKREGLPPALPLSPEMYRNLHPDFSEIQIMVKALSNLLLRGFSADEVKRFEFFLGQRIESKIDSATFKYFLDLSYKDGGVGLWKQRAIKLAELTEDLITQKRQLTNIYLELERNPGTPLSEEVHILREWILKEYHGKVTNEQYTRLDKSVEARLRGNMSAEEFRNLANLSFTKEGIGFSLRTTEHISERLESALALGHAGNVLDALALTPNTGTDSESDSQVELLAREGR